MTMVRCTECGRTYSSKAAACPVCAAPVTAAVEPAMEALPVPASSKPRLAPGSKTLLVVLFIVIGIAVIAANAPTISILLGLGLVAFAVITIKRHSRPALAFVFAIGVEKRKSNVALGFAEALIGAFLLFAGASTHLHEFQRQKAAEGARIAAEERRKTQESELVTNAPAIATEIGRKVKAAVAALDKNDVKEAERLSGEASDQLSRYRTVVPVPAAIAAASTGSRPELDRISSAAKALAAGEQAARLAQAGDEKVRAKDFVGADEDYRHAQESYASVPSDAQHYANTSYDATSVAQRYNSNKRNADAEGKRQALAAAAEEKRKARQEKRRAKQQAELAAVEAVCGSKPTQSAWDGFVLAAKHYLEDHLNDPDSFKAVGCTEPSLTKSSCWVTKCQFRAKNAFGGMIVQTMQFSIGAPTNDSISGTVLSATMVE